MPVVKQHVKRWRGYLKAQGYSRFDIRLIARSHILRESINGSTPPRFVVTRYVNTDSGYTYFGCAKYCSREERLPNLKRQLRRLNRRDKNL